MLDYFWVLVGMDSAEPPAEENKSEQAQVKSSFRVSTALVTSLSLVATHLPVIALAQSADGAAACLEGESAEACLARALQEATVVDVNAAAEAARLAEEAVQVEAQAVEAAALAARLAEEAAAADAQAAVEAAAEAAAQPASAATLDVPAQSAQGTDEVAIAAALATASTQPTPVETSTEGATQTPDEASALTRAAIVAAEAEQVAAPDLVVEAETEAEGEALDAGTQMQSMALADDARPVGDVVNEVITEDTSRAANQEFAPIVSAEPPAGTFLGTVASPRSGRGGLSTLETALLAGAAGLVVGTILAGNRQVVNRADDRVVVLRPDGDYQVIRDDDVLLRRPGNEVSTENFADGSSRTIVTQPDGTQVITIRDRDLRILRRIVIAPDGTRTVLIDDTATFQPVVVSQLPQGRPLASAPLTNSADASALRQALEEQKGFDRSFSLSQIRSIRAVRDLAPAINLESVTFASGSASVGPDQARELLALGTYMSEAIARNPQEIFLVEGHTDAVGGAALNLALSDRRAESVALALSQYFGVAAQNMVIQGYGEEYLRVPTLAAERLNRRVVVRRITTLLQVAAAY